MSTTPKLDNARIRHLMEQYLAANYRILRYEEGKSEIGMLASAFEFARTISRILPEKLPITKDGKLDMDQL